MEKTTVGIVDYSLGNLRSVANAVQYIGAVPVVSSDVSTLDECDKIILPGVGAFPHGVKKLKSAGLFEFIKNFADSGRELLGICLGMQLLHEYSDEFGYTKGLEILSGHVESLTNFIAEADTDLRVPNVGWHPLFRCKFSTELINRMFMNVSDEDLFYFIHGYGVSTENLNALAISQFQSLKFSSVVGRENVVGTQFHPEKSREAGLSLLKGFIYS